MSHSFIMLQGVLSVEAKGYWYTNGGEKGSFGYYPHLKDSHRHPVYPDTQIHGDLRMAAQWLNELTEDNPYTRLIDKLFGRSGNDLGGSLYIQDLVLSSAACRDWNSGRFDVKSRIEIDDETRAVKDKMFTSFEAAWLDGLELESTFYAGYFSDKREADAARKLLEEVLQLLSGFGAFRSRGYGRGKMKIYWQDLRHVVGEKQEIPPASFTYTLKNLVNMRSKPVATERLQLVASNSKIEVEQLRGWFVRTYKDVTGHWPHADDMAKIVFSDLCPSTTAGELAFPPANTILCREDNSGIADYWGRNAETESAEPEQETFFEVGKLKPLPPDTYITATGKIVNPEVGVRFRNSVQEDFKTLEEGGLFVQQYVAQGTLFGGQIFIDKPDSTFSRTAAAIFKHLNPVINGTLFTPTLNAPADMRGTSHEVRLVTMPLSFNPGKKLTDKENITIGTQRRYAPALGRPRRDRPVILPGSIMTDNVTETINWPLFGMKISAKEDWPKPQQDIPLSGADIHWRKITRSQAGVLRELLNRDHNPDVIGIYLIHLRDKHQEKNSQSDLAKLYTALVEIHAEGNIDALRKKVTQILDYLKIEIWWQDNNSSETERGES